MQKRAINAADAPQPVGGYAQAVKIRGGQDLLVISGQIPMTATGTVPPELRTQADLCWANIDAQLRAAEMTRDHLVKATIFLSDRKYAIDNRAARQAYLGDRSVALTVIIAGIFDSAWLLEIEAIAVA